MAEASRSLPTMWIDQSFAPAKADAGALLSAIPPFRVAVVLVSLSLLSLPFPFVHPPPEPLPSASHTAIAIEYDSSPVPQPALHTRRVPGASSGLRELIFCGTTKRA